MAGSQQQKLRTDAGGQPASVSMAVGEEPKTLNEGLHFHSTPPNSSSVTERVAGTLSLPRLVAVPRTNQPSSN